MQQSTFPDFFSAAPTIVMHDPLAQFLGAASDGIIEYRYEDAVKLAGHSCPTVAGAFLATRAALQSLYGDALPQRGGIAVELRAQRDEGVAGVIAAVAGLITGATEEGGFRGIGGRFNRRDKLRFRQSLVEGEIRFARLDTGTSVELSIRVNRVPSDPRVSGLMARCLSGDASRDEQALFHELWQGRVRSLLIEHADDREVLVTHGLRTGLAD